MSLQFVDMSAVPPGGWEFYQPELGWKAPNPVQDPFWKLVDMVIALRKNNPRFQLPTSPEIVSLEIQAYNCPKVPERCRGWNRPTAVEGVVTETKRRKSGCGSCGR